MLRRFVVSCILIAAVLLVAGGIFAGLMATKQPPPTMEPERPALNVTAIRLTPQTVVVPLQGFGTAQAECYATISAQVSGQVLERPAALRVGSVVAADQLLLRIDDRDYQAQLDRARSLLAVAQATLRQIDVEEQNTQRLIETATDELAVAEREYSRVLALFEKEVSNPRELDAARVAVQQARRALQRLENDLALLPARREQARAECKLREADVALAELNATRCTIVAPFAGRIAQLDVEVGEQVAPGRSLLTLLDPRRIEIPIELPISLRNDVRDDAPAHLQLESDPQSAWTGRVARIAPSADEALRTFSLFIEVDNAEQANPLMPGMFVRAQIDGPSLPNALLVPRGAVRGEHVFISQNGHALGREVQIQHYVVDQAAIVGVQPGDIVITSNLDALYDGAPVEPTLDTPAAAASTKTTPQTP